MAQASTARRVLPTTVKAARIVEMHGIEEVLSFSAQFKDESFRKLETSG